jgi:four helix bundle protein
MDQESSTAGFEELDVYRLSERLADEVWKCVLTWDWFARDTVGRQLVKAADSVGANIAEGNGRFHYRDNRRFIRIARGSLYESRHWLRRAYRRELLPPAIVELLRNLLRELAPRLNAYLRSISARADREGSRIQEEPPDPVLDESWDFYSE